jgi:predicted MFS family arabinose efflux permease
MLASIALHGDVLIKLITVLIPIAVHIGDRLLGGLWAKARRTLVVLAVLSSLVFVFYTFFQAPKVNEVLFILFLIFWGGAVYSLIVELLRAGPASIGRGRGPKKATSGFEGSNTRSWS